MRVLIIEDNPTTAAFIYKGLKESLCVPEIAENGEIGLALARNQTYDAIILDVMLPKMDGWEVLQKIRQFDSTIPVIYLTARDAVNDRVKGLALGADDYLIKPFAFSELLARLHVLLRRQSKATSRVLTVADLIIDPEQFRATRQGAVLSLSAKEFMLLSLFANHLGRVLTRTFIAEMVWDIHFDSNTNAIDVAVKRLRDKVDQGHEIKLIHSVRGVGYVMDVR
jgi:two-component system copper resistance phosphate regulon response regulator CusR